MRHLPLALLCACSTPTLVIGDTGGPGKTDTPTGDDTDTDTTTVIDDTGTGGGTTPTDSGDRGPDTGIATLYFAGQLTATSDAYDQGYFGWGMYGLAAGDSICTTFGTLDEVGPTAHECPQCAWTYELSGPWDMTATGDYCDQFYDYTVLEGYLDGWEWGFADTYDLTYADQVFHLDESVLVYQAGYGFWPIAYNYAGSGRVTVADDTVAFWGVASTNYYYYYP